MFGFVTVAEKNRKLGSQPFVVATAHLRLFTVRSLGHHNFPNTSQNSSIHPFHNNFNPNMMRSISLQRAQSRPLGIRLALKVCSAPACRAQSPVITPLVCREQFARRASSSPPAPTPKGPKFRMNSQQPQHLGSPKLTTSMKPSLRG